MGSQASHPDLFCRESGRTSRPVRTGDGLKIISTRCRQLAGGRSQVSEGSDAPVQPGKSIPAKVLLDVKTVLHLKKSVGISCSSH